jgi:hypothetical protein
MSRYTITLEEDPDTGDLIMPLPDELLQEAGWAEGDTLEWIDNGDGTFNMIKQQPVTKTEPSASDNLVLTRSQIQRLYDLLATMPNLDKVELVVNHGSGIGQSITVRYQHDYDITDYETW